jgi:beta-phosphoglucomutase-like phosphatase (HAD superfamily)
VVHGCIHFVHKERMLQAVVFDMDGVIIDGHAAHRRAWKKFLHNQGAKFLTAN